MFALKGILCNLYLIFFPLEFIFLIGSICPINPLIVPIFAML